VSACARRTLQVAACVALACSLGAVADDDDKPAAAPQAAAVGSTLTNRQQLGLVVAHPLAAKMPDRIESLGLVLDTTTLVSDTGDMTAASVAARSSKAEVARLEGLYGSGAGASLKTLEAARADEAKAVAQSRFTVARFAQHWGPLANMPPANRQKFIEAASRGRSLLLRADLPGRHSLGSLPDTAQLDVDGVRVPGRILGLVGQNDETQGVGLLIGVDNAPAGLGPGALVPVTLMMAKRAAVPALPR